MSTPTIKAAAAYFRVPVEVIMGQSRHRELVKVRAAIILVMRYRDLRSFPQIGLRLGGRDHSTIVHVVREGGPVWRWMVDDQAFSDFVDAQWCLPRHSPVAATLPSPFAKLIPGMEREDRKVWVREPAPMPARVARLSKAQPQIQPAIRTRVHVPVEKIQDSFGKRTFTVDADGHDQSENWSWDNVVRGSQTLMSALRREHPREVKRMVALAAAQQLAGRVGSAA